MYQFRTEQWLPVSIEEAWGFFSDPMNLARITPPELDFRVLSDVKGAEIYSGMIIDYTVRPLWGIRVHWQTEISMVQKPFIFVDRQRKGPYRKWEHTHSFQEEGGGVLMKDVVDYEIPLGFIGRLMHRPVVRRELEKIFEFRRQTLEIIFKNRT